MSILRKTFIAKQTVKIIVLTLVPMRGSECRSSNTYEVFDVTRIPLCTCPVRRSPADRVHYNHGEGSQCPSGLDGLPIGCVFTMNPSAVFRNDHASRRLPCRPTIPLRYRTASPISCSDSGIRPRTVLFILSLRYSMSRQHSFFRQIVGAMIFIACLATTHQHAIGQAYCTDCTQPDQVWRVQLCMAPQPNITVDVTVCNQTFCPAQTYGHPCATQQINARTVIKKVCPVGWPGTGYPFQFILTKLITSLGPCCSNQTYYPACTANPDYHLLVSWANCWGQDPITKCWTPCANSPCCSALIQYRNNFPNPGDCSTTLIIPGCNEPGACPVPDPPESCESIPCHLNLEPCCQ